MISHNRRTIEAADALYGVSMGDDSTSRVLSLRLDASRRAPVKAVTLVRRLPARREGRVRNIQLATSRGQTYAGGHPFDCTDGLRHA
ncbi:MAG: hypothetical protein U0360_04935 [Dehalococcoidia bacterium]